MIHGKSIPFAVSAKAKKADFGTLFVPLFPTLVCDMPVKTVTHICHFVKVTELTSASN
jgi:hypothetical protein